MGLDDFAPAAAADVNLDEDLFDFPPMIIPEPARAEQPQADEAVVDDLDSGGDAAASSTGAKSSPKGCTGLDPELDHDLFGFPPLDLSSLGLNPDGSSVTEPEESSSGVEAAVQDLLEDDLSDIMRTAHVDQKRAEAQESVATAAAPTPASNPKPVAPQAPVGVPAPQPATLQAVALAGPTSKLAWVMTSAAIFFMLGLLGIAWRATSSVQQQLQTVQANVQTSVVQMQAASKASRDEMTRLELEMLRAQAQAPRVNSESAPRQANPGMAAPHEIVLQVARESIASGHHEEARRMLYALLAEADHLPIESREEIERKASFLIAASHKSEGENRQGDQR